MPSPCLRACSGEDAVMVVGDEVADGFAEVREEAVLTSRLSMILPVTTGRYGDRVVTASRAELGGEVVRPVDAAQLPTVRLQIPERLARERPGVGEQRLDVRAPVAQEMLLAHVVDDATVPLPAGGRDVAHRSACSRSAARPTRPLATFHRNVPSGISLPERLTTSVRRASSSPGSAGTSVSKWRVSAAEKPSLKAALSARSRIGLATRLGLRAEGERGDVR